MKLNEKSSLLFILITVSANTCCMQDLPVTPSFLKKYEETRNALASNITQNMAQAAIMSPKSRLRVQRCALMEKIEEFKQLRFQEVYKAFELLPTKSQNFIQELICEAIKLNDVSALQILVQEIAYCKYNFNDIDKDGTAFLLATSIRDNKDTNDYDNEYYDNNLKIIDILINARANTPSN